MTEDEREVLIKEKNLTAMRLVPEDIDEVISYCEYFRVANTTLTICAIVLKNGFSVVGKSAPISFENFKEDVGKKVAYADARRQIWGLEGYRIKSEIKDGSVPKCSNCSADIDENESACPACGIEYSSD